MQNKSKIILDNNGYDCKKLSIILDITERQAYNILSGNNLCLYKYLIISQLTNTSINDMFKLDPIEIEIIKKRVDIINSL